jgi:flagellar basal-body rod protein FlgG
MRALSIASTGMLAQQTNVEVIANNLANMNTTAFKQQRAEFTDLLYQNIQTPGSQTSDQGTYAPNGIQLGAGVRTAAVYRITTQGDLKSTGNPYDVAIQGAGYFAVQTATGLRYTRDGHFSLDNNGNLVTSQGYQVQGDGGPILITPNDGEINIAPDGTVSSVVNGIGNQLAKLKVVEFPNPSALTKQGANLYSTDQTPTTSTTATVRQGALEASNVQPIIEISHMIEVMRAYEATASLSKSQEDMIRQAINQLGQMPRA